MLTRFFSPLKHAFFPTKSSTAPSQVDFSSCTTTPLQDCVDEGDRNQRVSRSWYFLCYFLHALLVALHLILLVVAASGHPEHQITIPYESGEAFTTWLGSALQAFYTFYTAALVFLAQKLMLSAIFSTPRKLTQIHDICGAWAGIGAALNVLWQQTKVASSVPQIALVTLYFACISVLHVTSSTLVQFQLSNHTMTTILSVAEVWPDSANLTSLDWTRITAPAPFLHALYGNLTIGLANNTLYDYPYVMQSMAFFTNVVHAATLNAHCGLLTNLSADASGDGVWNINSSMSDFDHIGVTVSYPPLLNEIWLSPSIQCLEPICSTFILYLVSTAIEVDDSIKGNHVYINGTYYSSDGTIQNFSTPIYLVGCTLNVTNHTVILGPDYAPLVSNTQPLTNSPWSTFSPVGDINLTSAISYAMAAANSLPSSPYCQPIMSYSSLWKNITGFNAYMGSALGMSTSPCFGTSLAQYIGAPSSLTRGQFESAVSQVAAEFVWLAGDIEPAPQNLEYPTQVVRQAYRLNINALPVIFALCASIFPLVLVTYILRQRLPVVSGAGVLETAWLGSRSRAVRDHLKYVKIPSLDNLRTSSMFEIIFWTHRHQGTRNLDAVVPFYDMETDPSDSKCPGSLGSDPESSHSSDLSQGRPLHNISRIRHCCYVLHVVPVVIHVTLLICFIHHPEHSVVIPLDSRTMTVGLSALLQAFYTLYTAVLVLLMQRLALSKMICEHRKLTTVHDVSDAWTGIGSAAHILWQQRKAFALARHVIVVGAYLSMMLVLHVTSSSIMQWQAYTPTVTVQMDLAMPNTAVNISQLIWTEIFPIAYAKLPYNAMGLLGTVLFDTPQNFYSTHVIGLINSTVLYAQCGLVPNLTLSDRNPEGEYQINFQRGNNNGSFLVSPIWKDVVHAITPSTECAACSQTVFYMITTGINVDDSVQEPVAVELNWTYTSPGGSPQTSATLTYIAACSLSARTTLVFPSTVGEFGSLTSTSWFVWSPENATNLSVGMATALSKSVTSSFPMFLQGNSSANFTDMDSYIMSALALNLSYANTTSLTESSANPSGKLSPQEFGYSLAETAATLLFLAGRLGESGGGFQRSVGENQGMNTGVEMWRLHLNTIPVVVASIASFLSLILSVIIISKGPSREHPPLVSGTSVLECLWLEAHSELLHSRLLTVKEPRLDALREAGMFDICLGDIGLDHPEAERLIPEPVDG